MYPNNAELTTDFGTLKNDTQSNTISVVIPNNYDYDPGNPDLGVAYLDVGTINAGLRARANTSKYPGWYSGVTLTSTILVTIPTFPEFGTFNVGLYCNLDRISPSTVRLRVSADGFPGDPTYRTQESITVTFIFSTFLSSFD